MIKVSRFMLLGTLMVALVLGSGCGPGEKSLELKDLERILQDPEARNVKESPGASKPYRESRQFRRLALESWEEGKDDLSKEYAILGTLRYRTAAAIREQVEAKNRLDIANSKIETSNPEITALTQEKNKLQQQVSQLERQVGLSQVRVTGGTGAVDSAKQLAIRNRARDIEAAKKQADLVNAKKHAPEQYNRADNLAIQVRTQLADNQANDLMMTNANEAHRLFEEAKKRAEPGYREEVALSNPEERRANLKTNATKVYGSDHVITERTGVRIVLGGIFKSGSSSVSSDMGVMVDELTKLAKKYEEFDIFIEGYTSKTGSATENLGLSQIRANEVRDSLVKAGIKSSRIETRGYGQDRLRFGASDDRNERVEVVMTRN